MVGVIGSGSRGFGENFGPLTSLSKLESGCNVTVREEAVVRIREVFFGWRILKVGEEGEVIVVMEIMGIVTFSDMIFTDSDLEFVELLTSIWGISTSVIRVALEDQTPEGPITEVHTVAVSLDREVCGDSTVAGAVGEEIKGGKWTREEVAGGSGRSGWGGGRLK